MKRRDLLCHLPAYVAAPGLAQAAAGAKLLVVLSPYTPPGPEGDTWMAEELTRRGWRVGDNLRVEVRYAENRPERLDALARELVALQPTAALAISEIALRALMRHTTSTPMVVAYASDPVAGGLAASLRRPGGQVTGLTLQGEDIRPKTYELARQVAPWARRLASLFRHRNIPEAQFEALLAEGHRLARQYGLEYVPLRVRDAGEIEAALRSLMPVREHVLVISTDSVTAANLAAIAALARTLRLPSGAQNEAYAQAGGLFSYGPDLRAMRVRAVQMADQVLRGQPVGEIPFEQPTRIRFTLNRSTAVAIGLALPRELLLRADEVIG